MKGNIHSLESFGTVDGPGIRFVIFMQGCPLRCVYCHNPDTWDVKAKGKYQFTPEELLAEVLKYKNFIARGGVTVTGGEPLLQAAFLTEFFKLCRQEGIHTALDTSGCIFNVDVQALLNYVDLVLLDIKSIDRNLHKIVTGVKIDHTLTFLNYLQEQGVPTWIRHVLVTGLTDKKEHLEELAAFLSRYSVVEKVELLPYHSMGVFKYDQLGIPYSLKKTEAFPKEKLEEVKEIFRHSGLTV